MAAVMVKGMYCFWLDLSLMTREKPDSAVGEWVNGRMD